MSRRPFLGWVLPVAAASAVVGVASLVIVLRPGPSEEEKIKRLIPAAASMRVHEQRQVFGCGSHPPFDRLEDQSLTAVYLWLQGSCPDPLRPPDWQYLGPITYWNINDLYHAVHRNGAVSVIHDKYIMGFSCHVRGGKAVGRTTFEAKGQYRGQVDFSAERRSGRWRITEFHLPASGLALRLGDDGLWKLRKPE